MRVLVVEDDKLMMELLEKALFQEGFVIDRASDGQEALQRAKENKYDVILLDIMLPKKSGCSVITSLRTLKNDTPILAISANSLTEIRVNALNLGADDFLVKGFSFEELVARMKGLIRRRSGNQSNIFRCKDIVVNLTDMTVQYKEKKIKLTKKEFQILSLLIRNKNTVVARSELLNLVWNSAVSHQFSNTVDVHIQSLRKKLGEGGKAIETIRGCGYIIRSA
ncbi:response regulator transcription factor [Candidatus Gracilibacteria bacterium]|nr:response regulator transcription factor [Candidatus Gracilibacteria bacterium]